MEVKIAEKQEEEDTIIDQLRSAPPLHRLFIRPTIQPPTWGPEHGPEQGQKQGQPQGPQQGRPGHLNVQ